MFALQYTAKYTAVVYIPILYTYNIYYLYYAYTGAQTDRRSIDIRIYRLDVVSMRVNTRRRRYFARIIIVWYNPIRAPLSEHNNIVLWNHTRQDVSRVAAAAEDDAMDDCSTTQNVM